jgi:electron transfer flavoprotein-quinone oxidoreductase
MPGMESFDIIVVGAGPAGSAAAYVTARAGLKTLLIERGKSPGDKNLFGGRIYDHTLRSLLGGLEGVPYERRVTREMLGLMTERSAVTMTFQKYGGEVCSFTARRSKFDSWLAQKAEEAGALLVTSTKVDGLHREDGRIAGIKAGGEVINCGCVIDAEGVTATLAREAGLRKDVTPADVKIGVKETVELPREKIEERFNISGDEGAACVLVGYPSSYTTAGGAFIYTNSDTLSIGIVMDAFEIVSHRLEVPQLIENFRMHPFVQQLVSGGSVIEYSAHMIPSVPSPQQQSLYTDGFLVVGDAGGFFINHGFTYRGVDMAIASGMCAANAAVKAHSSGGYSKSNLSSYVKELSRQVMPELRAADRTRKALYNRKLFSIYPQVASETLDALFSIDGFGPKGVRHAFRRGAKGRTSLLSTLMDLYSLYRNM